MPIQRTKKIPSCRHHKARGLAVVTLDGHDVYLGAYGSAESKEAYDRTIAEWLAHVDDHLLALQEDALDDLRSTMTTFTRRQRKGFCVST